MIRPRKLAVELAVLGCAIAVLAALGPFGSYDQSPGRRLLHWSLYLVAGYVFFRPVIAAGGALARQTGLHRASAIAIACAFGAFPTSIVVAFVPAGTGGRGVGAGALAGSYFQVLIIGATVTILQLLASREQTGIADRPGRVDASTEAAGDPAATEPVPDQEESISATPAFLALLPPHLRDGILCLENEDHYVRVHGREGSALVLMRMRDAAAQMGSRGERVHRSWWVAREAVATIVRQDRSLKLRLVDGREVPVARASVATLRDKGWLADAGPLDETH